MKGDFTTHAVRFIGEIDHLRMLRFARPVQMLDKLDDAPFVAELFLLIRTLIAKPDPHAAVQERQFLEPFQKCIGRKIGDLEDAIVGLECCLGADLFGRANTRDRTLRNATLIFLLVDVVVATNFDLAPLRKKIDDGHSDSMQPAGCLVCAFLELAAKLEHRHHAFNRRDLAPDFFGQLLVTLHRYSATIVFHGHRTVVVHRYVNVLSVPGHGFVDRVVDDFVHQMMNTSRTRVADIHTRPFPHMLQVR